ncbi:sugar nucleotide-binding protein [Neisseriaceae bacterium B1]
MNILLLGGNGFIGSRVAKRLCERGHTVTTPNRSQINLLNLNESAAKSCLHNQEVIVNCVGVMSRHTDVLETVHHHAIAQLAAWAQECGVLRWVQLSALGADAEHEVAFVGSKGRGDLALCNSGLNVNIARPSVVFGRSGESCEMFLKLAKLPVIALPDGGQHFYWQPVHVDDVAMGLANMVDSPLPHAAVVDMVGATRHSVAEYMGVLREKFYGKQGMKIIPIPMALIVPTLPLTNMLSNGFLSAGSMKLLAQGSCADKADFVQLLGREPLGVWEFSY